MYFTLCGVHLASAEGKKVDKKFLTITSSQLENRIYRTEFNKNNWVKHDELILQSEANGISKKCHKFYTSIQSVNQKDINDGKITLFDALQKTPEYLSTTEQKKSENFKYLQFARLRSAWTYMNSLCIPFDKNGNPINISKSEMVIQGTLWGYIQTSFRTLRLIEFKCGYFESCEGTWIFFKSGGKNDCYSRGIQLIKRGIEMESNHQSCYKNLADAFACQVTPFHNMNKAEENYKKALSIYPEYSNAIFQLADLYTNKIQLKEANLMLEKYLSVTPSRIHTEFPCTYLKSKIQKIV